jgi:hypothetical protein
MLSPGPRTVGDALHDFDFPVEPVERAHQPGAFFGAEPSSGHLASSRMMLDRARGRRRRLKGALRLRDRATVIVGDPVRWRLGQISSPLGKSGRGRWSALVENACLMGWGHHGILKP